MGLVRGTRSRDLFVGLIEGLFVGELARSTSTTSTSFTNSTSATSVGEPWPKTLYAIFLDDLGFLIRRPKFFVFYYVSQQWYQSDPWLDACLGLDHMCDMRHWFSCCFPVMWFFLCLMASWGFATRIEFSIDPSMLLSVCWLPWSWSTSNSLDLILISQ